MLPRKGTRNHPAAAMLLRYAQAGCPVDCGRNWTPQELQAAVDRGAHPSAQTPDAATACRREALERVADGCCKVVKWKDIKTNPPPNLKISPIAAIPHKSRQFRMILDLSFSLKVNGAPIQSVNDASDKTLAPQHAMYELGNVIPRIIHTMAAAPNTGIPFLFSKVDLKDGYWRMVVDTTDAWNFAYVLPPEHPTDDPELVIPDSLQMGWSESPPFFCAATETARDVAAHQLATNQTPPKHHMENIMMDIDWSKIPAHAVEPHTTKFLTLLEVYVDDFIALVQTTNPAHLLTVTRTLLHAIDNVFPGPEISGSTMGPAVSTKKLIAEGTWETRKEILGWVLDGIKRTIELPPDKVTKLLDTMRTIRRTSGTITLSDFQKLHGKLQFTSIALPCGKALLGPLDRIISETIKRKAYRIKVKPHLRDVLTDWAALLRQAGSRPTHVQELVEHTPSYRGFVDASKWGVGGVWFSGSHNIEPMVWFEPWPDDIKAQFCSSSNPKGTITISDLELAGIFFHFLALEAHVTRIGKTLKHQSIAIWCDNLPAVAWTYKFRTATSLIAARILRALAIRLHATHSALLNVQHISGIYNTMADYASRTHTLDSHDFLVAFTTTFPPPKNGYWTLYLFATNTASRVFSELRPTPSPLASWRRLTRHAGAFGKLGASGFTSTSLRSTRNSPSSHHHSKSTCWLPSPTMCDPDAFLAQNAKFEPKQSKWRYAPSARSSSWTENAARWERRKQATLRQSTNNWRATKERTRHPSQSSPSPSKSHGSSTSQDAIQTPHAPKPSATWQSSHSTISCESGNTRTSNPRNNGSRTNSQSPTLNSGTTPRHSTTPTMKSSSWNNAPLQHSASGTKKMGSKTPASTKKRPAPTIAPTEQSFAASKRSCNTHQTAKRASAPISPTMTQTFPAWSPPPT